MRRVMVNLKRKVIFFVDYYRVLRLSRFFYFIKLCVYIMKNIFNNVL
jgi:hypothetical protein